MVFCQMSDISSRPGLFNSISAVRTLICRLAMIIIYASIIILVKAKNLGREFFDMTFSRKKFKDTFPLFGTFAVYGMEERKWMMGAWGHLSDRRERKDEGSQSFHFQSNEGRKDHQPRIHTLGV